MSVFDRLITVKSFLFCISLKAGSIIIGVLGVLSCISIQCIFEEKFDWSTLRQVLYVLEFIVVVSDIIYCMASVVLLFGIFMKNDDWFLFWLYPAIMDAVIQLIFSILTNIIFSYMYLQSPFPWVITFCCSPVTALVVIYFVIVVNSYRLQLKEESQ